MADAGWYPDPRGRHEHRYFDGTQWTDHVADDGRGSTDPVNAPLPPAAPPSSTSPPGALGPVTGPPPAAPPGGAAFPPPPTYQPPPTFQPPPAPGPTSPTERVPGWYPEPIPEAAPGAIPFKRPRRTKPAISEIGQYSTPARVLVLGGAVALVIGAFMPWVKASLGFLSVQRSGIDGDGAFTLVCGIAAAVLFWVVVSRAGRIIVLIAGGFALAISIYDIVNISSKADELSSASGAFSIDASVGLGLWLSAIAAAAVVVGAVLAIRDAS